VRMGFKKGTNMKYLSLQEQLNLNQQLLQSINEQLTIAPAGELRMRKHNNGYQWWVHYPGSATKDEYIKGLDKDKHRSYANKYYLSLLKKEIEKENNILIKSQYYNPENKGTIYDNLPSYIKQYVTPLHKSTATQIQDWYERDFQSNTFDFSPMSSFTTQKGEIVRSRAELIIANELAAHNLYYHYEEVLTLSSGKKRYPDFTVAHPATGEFYYIEFFGMMNNEKYALDAYTKIQEYSNDAVFPKMIFMFDYVGAPFTNTTVTNIIKTYFS